MKSLIDFWERGWKYVARTVREHRQCSLGVCYNLYDGEELLESSVKSIRKVARFVCVVYQDVSNSGEQRGDGSVAKLLNVLKGRRLIDEVVCYHPDLTEEAWFNERKKRILGMQKCKAAGCTHYLLMDVDEYYRETELKEAFKFIQMNGVDISAVSIIEYVKSPQYRLLYNTMFSPGGEEYTFYVPFICKVGRVSRFGLFPCLVDGTRDLMRRGRFYLFPKGTVAMHHMSTVRRDLNRKFRNSTLGLIRNKDLSAQICKIEKQVRGYSFKLHGPDVPHGLDFIGSFPVRKVENEFLIPNFDSDV